MIEIILPALGEGVVEATITKIMVKKGDKVNEDDILLEIATDKVDTEINAPSEGIVGDILFDENDTVAVGTTIMYLLQENENIEQKRVEKKTVVAKTIETDNLLLENDETSDITENISSENSFVPRKTKSGKFLSPLVRNLIKSNNISLDDVDKISGSGINGRITKNDVLQFLENKQNKPGIEALTEETKTVSDKKDIKEITFSDEDEIVELDRVRLLIAEHMLNSIKTSAHVMSAIETDVTNLVDWREKNKQAFYDKYGEKLTFTPVFIEAVAKALKDFPKINASLSGNKLIVKKNINIGMATALPDGNLIVPVIKNADALNIVGLAKRVNDLASRARNNNLKPDEIQGGTFTITNYGTYDNIFGTPIINQPQIAILGFGAIRKQVSVIETSSGDSIGIRKKIILSLSYDHRVVDGALGGMFLKKVSDYLENFNEFDF